MQTMDGPLAGDEPRRTSVSTSSSTPASSNSSRRSSTVRRTNSRRKPHTPACGSAGPTVTPTSTLRHHRSSDLDEEAKDSLTSFPSLSPEVSPHIVKTSRKAADAIWAGSGRRCKNGGKTEEEKNKASTAFPDPDSTPRQSLRLNLVETLMSKGNPTPGRSRDALFADSPATTAQDVPGALHHASDDHIRRVAAKRGIVTLVRQLAGDLAQREAEMTILRLRAEARERELKRMLREVEVSNLDIERRLHRLEEQETSTNGKAKSNRNSLGSVGDLVGEAIGDSLNTRDEETFLTETTVEDKQATIKASALADAESLSSSMDSGKKQSWMNYFLGSSSTVRKQRTGSPSSQEAGSKTTLAIGRRRGLDDTTFQPPALDEQTRDLSMTRANSSTSHTAARRASKSAWTMKLFAGNNIGSKDGEDFTGNRGRSSTAASEATRSLRDLSRGSKHTIDSITTKTRSTKRNSIQTINTGIPVKGDSRSVSNAALASPGSFEPTQNLGPVEMDAILPHGSRPPTLSPQISMDGQSDILTDRFGFIYDQRRRKKEAEAIARSKGVDPSRERETLGNLFEIPASAVSDAESTERSATPTSLNDTEDNEDDAEGSNQQGRKWQDYLKISTFSTELLSQTPLPVPIAAVETPKNMTKKSLKRSPTFDEDLGLTLSNQVPSASTVSGKAEPARPVLSGPNSPAPPSAHNNDTEPVKLLLSQLGDLHDKLQREKTVKWNEFMRKVRAERRREGESAASSEARGISVAELPEAQIVDGEIIGIASLGHKGKVGRAKYREFRALVLAGIPVVHRAKIWSECSGANTLRIPGYYQELASGQEESDPAVVAQIEMDINRTLTDNVFFRKGPGVDKLSEILLAYARRNPEVGYCQGMNLITASLLLITPTAEDAFWILSSLVENILPRHYYDSSLLASRADQQVLRSYVAELLPKLASHLDELSVELEALTFQWFLSLFTACLSAEALYRVWDVLLCLNQDPANGGSTFLFQVSLALLKLNEQQLLACETPGEIYTYLGGEITNHAISIDGLIRASEGLKTLVKKDEVEERRRKWVEIEEETIREREMIRSGAAPTGKKQISVEA